MADKKLDFSMFDEPERQLDFSMFDEEPMQPVAPISKSELEDLKSKLSSYQEIKARKEAEAAGKPAAVPPPPQYKPEQAEIRPPKPEVDVRAALKAKEGYAGMLPKSEKKINSRIGSKYGTYYDGKGLITAGYGHLLQGKELEDYKSGKTKNYWDNLSEEEADRIFTKDLKKHENEASRLTKDYDNLPKNVKDNILFATYRGSWGQSPKARKLFNSGRYSEAADEFLDSDEYRLAKGGDKNLRGVAKRMEDVADAIRSMGRAKPSAVVAPLKSPEAPEVLKELDMSMFDETEDVGGTGEAFILSALDTAAFGFGEEIVAAAKAGKGTIEQLWNDAPDEDKLSFLERYVEARDKGEDYMEALRKANPGAAFLGDIVGGLAVPGLGMAKAVKTGLGAAMAAGAAGGSIYGFGESKEGLIGDSNKVKLLQDTLMGAAGGAAGGAIARGLVKVLSKAPKVEGHAKLLDEIGDELQDDLVKEVGKLKPKWGKEATRVTKVLDMDEIVNPTLRKNRDDFVDWLYNNYTTKIRKPLDEKAMLEIEDEARRVALGVVGEEDAYGFDSVFKQAVKDLSDSFTKPSQAEIRKAAVDGLFKKGLNPEDAYKMFKEESLIKTAYLDRATKAFTESTGIPQAEIKPAILDKFRDLNVIAEQTDRLSPLTNFRGTVNEVASSYIKFQEDSAYFTGLLRNALKKSKGIDKKTLANILETPAADVPEKYMPIKKMWTELTEEMYEYGVKNGVYRPGQKIADYFHHTRLNEVDMVRALRKTLGKGSESVMASKEPEFRQLRQVMRTMLDLDVGEEITAKHINSFKNKIDDPEFLRKTLARTEVGSAFTREGKIPDLIREFDAGKAFGKYINQLTRTPHFAKPLAKLRSEIEILRQMGLTRRADYWTTYLDNMHGVKHRFANAIDDGIKRFKLNLTKDADYLGEQLGLPKKLAYNATDIMSWMGGVAYNNLLGFHPYAVIRNLGQPHFLTARELASTAGKGSNTYYHGIAARAQFETLMEFMKRGGAKGQMFKALANMSDDMVKAGKAPGEFVGEVEPMIRELGKVSGLGKEAVDSFGKIGMYFYGKSDMINRMVTDKMAKAVAKNAIRGDKVALKSVTNIPGRMGAEMKAAIKAKDLNTLHDLLSHHLIGKTQFHYGPHGAAEFVREWGRIVGMFSKWPVAVVSDVEDLLRRQEFRKLGAKYLSPVLTLMAGQAMLEEVVDEKDPIKRALLGRNMVDMAPVWSLNVSTPPAISTVMGAINAMKNMARHPKEPGKSFEQLEATLRPWIPIYGHISTQVNRYKDLK